MALRNVLLGFLEAPAAGYDIKRSFEESLAHLWTAESSQIYGTLRALEKEGLLVSSMEKSSRGPARRVYRRTAAGEQALDEWLDAEPESAKERLSVLCQMHFLSRTRDPKQVTRFLERIRERFQQQLEAYEDRLRKEESATRDRRAALLDNLALDLGRTTLRARVAWCNDVIAQIEGWDAAGA